MPAIRAGNFIRGLSNRGTSSQLRAQWRNPGDILSLLLLVGGDVVQRAIAQLAGDPSLPTPVVFSFGWVAYAFTALLSAVGDNRLMPSAPDLDSLVVSVEQGHARKNQSWILGRILRDYDTHWMPSTVKSELEAMLSNLKERRPKAGLCITVFDADRGRPVGDADRDLLWIAGYLVALIQLVISIIPWMIWQEWETFAITASGTTLAFLSASLPQWKYERWPCRRNSNKTICLTEGNGSQHVLVIRGLGHGLDLEDLASARPATSMPSSTRPVIVALAVLWTGLLITVSGIKDHTWFLVAIGSLGTLYTVVAAGAARKPEAFGIPLRLNSIYVKDRVMETLKSAELDHSGVGLALLPVFFPGRLRDEEASWWEKAETHHTTHMKAIRESRSRS